MTNLTFRMITHLTHFCAFPTVHFFRDPYRLSKPHYIPTLSLYSFPRVTSLSKPWTPQKATPPSKSSSSAAVVPLDTEAQSGEHKDHGNLEVVALEHPEERLAPLPPPPAAVVLEQPRRSYASGFLLLPRRRHRHLLSRGSKKWTFSQTRFQKLCRGGPMRTCSLEAFHAALIVGAPVIVSGFFSSVLTGRGMWLRWYSAARERFLRLCAEKQGNRVFWTRFHVAGFGGYAAGKIVAVWIIFFWACWNRMTVALGGEERWG